MSAILPKFSPYNTQYAGVTTGLGPVERLRFFALFQPHSAPLENRAQDTDITQEVFERSRIPTLASPHRCLVIRIQRSKSEGFRFSYLASTLQRRVRPKGHVLFYNECEGSEQDVQQIKSVLGLKHKRKRCFHGMQLS